MVRPIDLQQVLSQSTTLEKVQSVKQQHPDMEHRHFVLELQKMDQLKKERVQDTANPEKIKVREEEKKKEEERRKKRDNRPEGSKDQKDLGEVDASSSKQRKIIDLII